MKLQILILTLVLLCIQAFILSAQTSPISWINKSYNIHIDTISNKKIQYANYNSDYGSKVNTLEYTFKNIGKHITFVDTVFQYDNQFVTKPQETSTVSLVLSSTPLNLQNAFEKRQDTTATIILPFYYAGKIYPEKVTCELSFGKSKLIEYDSFYIDATEKVAQSVKTDSNNRPSIRFTHYFTIKNISKQHIFCTKHLTAWYDASSLRNRGEYKILLPGETYQIPAQTNMHKKYRFYCPGRIEVFAEGISEIHQCKIISKFEKTDK